MREVIYSGDGLTTNFVFSFPFFMLSDVKVSVNENTITSGFQLVPINAPEDSNIPYVGGTIVFDFAPKKSDTIKIFRVIGFERLIDYQPTQSIDPQALNQDFSFVIEKLKDFDASLNSFYNKYSDIVNSDSYQSVSEKLDKVSQQLTSLGGVENIASKPDITALQNAESFATSGKETIISWSLLDGRVINLNFLSTEAGTYSYVPETYGILSVVIKASSIGDCSILAPSGVTLFNKRLQAGIIETILLPVHKGLEVKITIPNLSQLAYQRLFFFKGV